MSSSFRIKLAKKPIWGKNGVYGQPDYVNCLGSRRLKSTTLQERQDINICDK